MSNENIENINEEIENAEAIVEETEISNGEISDDEAISEDQFEEQLEQPIEFDEAHSMAMHSYVKLSDKYADVLSSATTMLLVGGIGMVLLICLMNGVFPVDLGQTAWLFYSVMGIVFVAFIIAGFISYKNAMELKSSALEEDKLIDEINAWADENIQVSEIDKDLDLNDSIEELFFSRFATIKDKLMHQFETADEPLIDELAEQIYQKLYESDDIESSAEEDKCQTSAEEAKIEASDEDEKTSIETEDTSNDEE